MGAKKKERGAWALGGYTRMCSKGAWARNNNSKALGRRPITKLLASVVLFFVFCKEFGGQKVEVRGDWFAISIWLVLDQVRLLFDLKAQVNTL